MDDDSDNQVLLGKGGKKDARNCEREEREKTQQARPGSAVRREPRPPIALEGMRWRVLRVSQRTLSVASEGARRNSMMPKMNCNYLGKLELGNGNYTVESENRPRQRSIWQWFR
jgi:hypothetical protein